MDLHQDDPNYKLVIVKKKIKVPKARLPSEYESETAESTTASVIDTSVSSHQSTHQILIKKKLKVIKPKGVDNSGQRAQPYTLRHSTHQKLSNPSLPEPHLQPVVISARSQEERLGDRQQRRRRLSLENLEPPAEQDEEDDTDTPAFR